MAIWEDAAFGTKCPGCAGNLFFDENFQKMVCKACGSFFEPESLDFAYQLRIMDTDKASDDDTRIEFVCDSCGATVITDKNTVADICAFCGSPVIAKRRLINEFKPDYVIPFKISQKDAEQRFHDWAKGFKKSPRGFRSRGVVSKIRGVYVPFWLVDAQCCFDYLENYDQYSRNVDLKRIPFDGSIEIPDALMRAIEPYNYDEMVPYHDGYLHGFFANRYDKPLVEMTDIVYRRVNDYLYDMFFKATTITMNKDNLSSITHISQAYALLPVWFVNYEHDGEKYQFAMNGQTGEIQGFRVPYSKFFYGYSYFKKYIALFVAGLVALITLALAGGVIYSLYNVFWGSASTVIPDANSNISVWILFALPVYGFLLFKFMKSYVLKAIKETGEKPVYYVIDKAPEVYEYLDTSSIKEDKHYWTIH